MERSVARSSAFPGRTFNSKERPVIFDVIVYLKLANCASAILNADSDSFLL